MFGSKNDFFKQSPEKLAKAKENLELILRLKDRSQQDIDYYLEAYDFFVKHPTKYDGATIVKDLVDIRVIKDKSYLDCDAMLHDYEYIVGANKCFVKKWKSDYRYIKNMEINGKGIRVFRFILLTVAGILFVPYKLLSK